MSKVYVPSRGPDDWQRFLADPEKQWRRGFSARTAAYSWESANGLPPEIEACLLYTSPSPRDRTRYRMPSSA